MTAEILAYSQSKRESTKTAKMLAELIRRINEHLDYYNTNQLVSGTFEFLINIIDRWYCEGYHLTT